MLLKVINLPIIDSVNNYIISPAINRLIINPQLLDSTGFHFIQSVHETELLNYPTKFYDT